jgi:hypothetical protein
MNIKELTTYEYMFYAKALKGAKAANIYPVTFESGEYMNGEDKFTLAVKFESESKYECLRWRWRRRLE